MSTPAPDHQPFLPGHSIKGIVFENGKIWLRKNEFGKWELPGGMIDRGEQPETTIVRELREELGLDTTVNRLVDVTLWYRGYGRLFNEVLLITYLCDFQKRVGDVEHIGEGGRAEFRAFTLDEIDQLDLPDSYRKAIAALKIKETA